LGFDNPRASRKQANANKNKKNRFHLLSFIFLNRGFSKGYGRFKQKIPQGSRLAQRLWAEGFK